MASWTVTFFVITLIAGIIGLSGIPATAIYVSRMLFVIFLLLYVVALVMERRPPG